MPNYHKIHQRRGAVIPLFAIVFSVLLIFCSMAINLAHVQLTNTEMQIALDATVHAGGRRLGTPIPNEDGSIQTLSEARADVLEFANYIASLNTVAGSPAVIPESLMEFGRSTRALRANGSFESYQFNPVEDHQIPSSFRIISNELQMPYVFGAFTPSDTFTVGGASVSTQVDRDVVLVLDRSGSMVQFEDEPGLGTTIAAILSEEYIEVGETIYEYRVQWSRPADGIDWRDSGLFGPYMTQDEFDSFTGFPSRNIYRLNYSNSNLVSHTPDQVHDKITETEHDHARFGRPRFNGDYPNSLYEKWYTNNLIYWLEVAEAVYDDPDVANDTWTHLLGDDPEEWTSGLSVEEQRALLRGRMALYAHDYRHRYRLNDFTIAADENLENRQAPDFSRWYHLDRGVTVFLNVLGGGVDPDGTTRDGTVQKELISFLPFNYGPNNAPLQGYNADYHEADFDYGLQDDGFPSAFVNNSNDPGYAQPHSGSSLSLREILGTICPHGSTAIGDSLREAVLVVRNPNRARTFAAKTIVVLTDGDNTFGDDPVTVAQQELANEDVLVHTITFTPGVSTAGRTAMSSVAGFGKGRHYHTDSGGELSRIFEEIANNLPTILTE